MPKIFIYGVGNPYRCDDTVGIKVAQQLEEKIKDPHITIRTGSIDGLTILDEIIGYDKVIVIDSVKTKDGSPGDIYKINMDLLENTPPLSASHGIDFLTALRLGKKFGYDMPEEIDIYAIEIQDNTAFKEECTPKVEASIPEVAKRIMEDIWKEGNSWHVKT